MPNPHPPQAQRKPKNAAERFKVPSISDSENWPVDKS